MRTLKVSAKWFMRKHDCTLSGILTRCGAACCTSGPGGTYWPPKAFGNAPRQPCGNLGPNGCKLSLEDKPITCLLYPAILNKKDTMVLHHRVVSHKSCCKTAHGNGPHLIEALGECFRALFGQEQYTRVLKDVLAGKDSHFEISEKLQAQWDRERETEKKNLPPQPRSTPV